MAETTENITSNEAVETTTTTTSQISDGNYIYLSNTLYARVLCSTLACILQNIVRTQTKIYVF